MEQQDSNCGLRLPDDYLDDDDIDDDEIVIFDLPKHHPRHALLRCHDTPESSYDSDTSEISTPSCCHLISSCRDKSPRVNKSGSGSESKSSTHNNPLQTASVRFNIFPMEKKRDEHHGTEEEGAAGDCSREKDVDTSLLHEGDETPQQLQVRFNNNRDIADDAKDDNTSEKDLNNHKDNIMEKDLKENYSSDGKDLESNATGVFNESKELTSPALAASNIVNTEQSKQNSNTDSNRLRANAGKPDQNSPGLTSGSRKNTMYSFEEIIATLEDKIKVKLTNK